MTLASFKHQLLTKLSTNQIKMKSIILVALALAAVVTAAPVEEKKPAIEILEYNLEQQPDGSYTFYYKTSDGSSRQETGVVKEALDEDNKPRKVIIVSGAYTVLDAEGQPDTITYSADEGGYHADGKSIPRVAERR